MANADDLARAQAARIPKEKPPYRGPRRVSKKKQAQQEAEKKLVSSDGDTFMERFYKAIRKNLTGTCQCGCGNPSQKKDDIYFRHSIAHIFPKRLFPSVMYNPFNFVERRFWAGNNGTSACHSLMDDTSMERWPNMADWWDIKAKFYILAPLLTPGEKALNFYTRLEKLVNEN